MNAANKLEPQDRNKLTRSLWINLSQDRQHNFEKYEWAINDFLREGKYDKYLSFINKELVELLHDNGFLHTQQESLCKGGETPPKVVFCNIIARIYDKLEKDIFTEDNVNHIDSLDDILNFLLSQKFGDDKLDKYKTVQKDVILYNAEEDFVGLVTAFIGSHDSFKALPKEGIIRLIKLLKGDKALAFGLTENKNYLDLLVGEDEMIDKLLSIKDRDLEMAYNIVINENIAKVLDDDVLKKLSDININRSNLVYALARNKNIHEIIDDKKTIDQLIELYSQDEQLACALAANPFIDYIIAEGEGTIHSNPTVNRLQEMLNEKGSSLVLLLAEAEKVDKLIKIEDILNKLKHISDVALALIKEIVLNERTYFMLRSEEDIDTFLSVCKKDIKLGRNLLKNFDITTLMEGREKKLIEIWKIDKELAEEIARHEKTSDILDYIGDTNLSKLGNEGLSQLRGFRYIQTFYEEFDELIASDSLVGLKF